MTFYLNLDLLSNYDWYLNLKNNALLNYNYDICQNYEKSLIFYVIIMTFYLNSNFLSNYDLYSISILKIMFC